MTEALGAQRQVYTRRPDSVTPAGGGHARSNPQRGHRSPAHRSRGRWPVGHCASCPAARGVRLARTRKTGNGGGARGAHDEAGGPGPEGTRDPSQPGACPLAGHLGEDENGAPPGGAALGAGRGHLAVCLKWRPVQAAPLGGGPARPERHDGARSIDGRPPARVACLFPPPGLAPQARLPPNPESPPPAPASGRQGLGGRGGGLCGAWLSLRPLTAPQPGPSVRGPGVPGGGAAAGPSGEGG